MLEQQFGKDMPGLCRLFEDKGLSDLEFRTSLLLLLDYDEGTVAGLTQSSSQTINSAKVRANQKLFIEKGAKTLQNQIRSALRPFSMPCRENSKEKVWKLLFFLLSLPRKTIINL